MRAYGQTDTIRYVHPNGVYSNDGLSWATATNKLQDAINDLRDYLRRNNLTSGSVYVAAGTYVPTESTESAGGSMLNTSFKIYAGIHVYGGFNPDSPESKPGDRLMINGKKCSENWADPSGIGTTSRDEIASQWDLQYKTILSGNHSTSEVAFTFDSIRGRFNTSYPANSYHVVWFATNGEYTGSGVNDSTAGHYRGLDYMASVDGCVITSGNASSRNTNTREHTAFGGGVYMVANSQLRNCTVERCNATLRGGGIYMDGGGVAEFCYVHTCQSTGVGVVQGYGGGVCIEHEGSIGHSHITNCAARCGGGVLICHVPEEFPHVDEISFYSPFATACVINNNTASAEGGGIYLAEGGTVNHCTVTGNNCIGPDVTYYGRRHGRSGGIYVRNCGMVFNSVFWGNRCASNNDIQFATVHQRVNPEHEVYVYHTAFMNHDISDWTGVTKEMVFSIEKENYPKQGSTGNYPCFFDPTVDPTNWKNIAPSEGLHGPGVFMHLTTEQIPGPRIWHLTSFSGLDHKGVQVTDAVQDVKEWIRHAHTDYGVVSNPFEPVSTLGALVRRPDALAYALVAPQGLEGRQESGLLPTLFIDPKRPGVYDSIGNFVPQDKEGNSWDTPIQDIGEAMMFFRQYLVDDEGGNHHYMIPALDEDGQATGEPTRYEYIQILVKEGTITTAGPGNYLDRNVRSAAIRVDSHMRLYGGYPTKLKGTDTSKRNPRDYVSNITANITGIGGSRGYENNAAHVIVMGNVEHSIVDGFTLSDANTHNVYLSNSAHAGGGVLVNNSNTAQSKRIHMCGNQLRNCVITNCSSPKGAAVYVNGEYPNSEGDVCYAELKMVNCVVRNNTADYEDNHHNIDDHGIITANGRAYIEIEHCDIVNNVGYPFKADDKKTDYDSQSITCENPAHYGHILHGFIRANNSIIFCNGDRPLDNRGDLGTTAKVMSVFPGGQAYVFGEYNMFDKDLRMQLDSSVLCPRGFFDPAFTITIPEEFVPEMEGVTTFGASLKAPLPSEKHNKAIFTRANSTDVNYPSFINPSRNVGHSTNGDKPLYGGTVSYAPLTTNPCVNAAGSEYADYENYDRTDNNKRDRGGAPDIGAIENADLPVAGEIIYVTPDGAGKRDGSSWSNAIAGNTVYRLYGAGPAAGDSIDAQNNARLVNATTGEPVLTTDGRYCGGFARSWFTTSKTGKVTETTVTDAWVTEDTVFVGGPRDNERTIGRENEFEESSSTNVINAGSSESGFVAGWNDDTRYPYGEISGASRSFWRANPYHSKTNWATSGYDVMQTFVDSCRTKGWINNTHRENYVSGLQWAVEEAARRNHAATRLEGEVFDTIVQVWVGAGQYTDYKGYVMRDSVTVLGGFPAGKYAAPGMNERQALMSDSNVIKIPKSLPAQDYDAKDYETILQISDVNPIASDTTLNPAAIKFQDNDLSRASTTDTRSYAYKTKHITNTYTFTTNETDNTTKYIYHPNFDNSSNLRDKNTGVPGHKVYGKSPAPADKDYWHFTYPTSQEYYMADITPQSATLRIFDYDSGAKIQDKSSRWFRSSNGSLTGLRMYQTMKNVEDGTHKLTLDMMGGYRSGSTTFDISTASNIWLYIQDAEGNNIDLLNANGEDIVDSIQLKCRDYNSPQGNTSGRVRNTAFRKTISFITTDTMDITIMVKVLDGTRNTPNRNATYGRADGHDPDIIPCEYLYDGNGCTGNNYGTNNPNRREFFITNLELKTVDKNNSYVFTNTDVVENDTVVDNPKATEVLSFDDYTVENSRTPLRKRVLTMPDVCVPTYGGGGIANPVNMDQSFGDNLPHTDRVWGPTKDKRTATTQTKQEDPHYVEYAEANWDGFTIRHGFLHDESMAHGGGAGVNMYEGGHLRNCIVINNIFASRNVKGGGIFCDGATSTIEGCFVLNNASVRGTELVQKQIFAGGMFMYEGTCFNSLFANNYSYGSAGGVGFCVGRFFNNTIAYNTGTLVEGGKINGGAVSLATSSNPNLFVANTVVYGNNGRAFREREESAYQGEGLINPFLHCYIQTEVPLVQDTYLKNIVNHEDNSSSYGIGNTLLNGVAPSGANSPFAADYVNGVYTPGNARATNDYRLVNIHDTTCVNKGTEEFLGNIFEALKYKNPGKTDTYISNLFIYKSVKEAKLPTNDVAFAKRVQDCQIDIGAYEYNAAYNIKPDTTTHPGKAIFYISYDSPGGDASGSARENAACAQKLQLVLDAAGRYKKYLMNVEKRNSTPVAEQPDSTWTVEVWLQGNDKNATINSEYGDKYTPTRSTKHSVDYYHDNTLDYSFIIPRGIYVKGGYKDGYYHYEDASGNEVASGTAGAHIVDDRDPLTYRSVLSGTVVSSTGAEGNAFHVVTFTKDLFSPDDEKVIGNGNQLDSICTPAVAENHRAVLDGLFIENGHANSPDTVDCIGAGAVVTDYAHIRNCVIQNNEALEYGGGLYLKPYALVSGTIIKNNKADIGGGMYIEAPASHNNDSLAHVYATTICDNTASHSAGGMWFENTYARVNSTVVWHNTANDNANVSGTFSRTSADTDYPFVFCAVESRRLEGQGNVELSPSETEGVRWDRQDPFDAILYYPIEMSSTLSHAGMSYREWNKLRLRFTTLDTTDIAGVSRTRWTATGAERGFAWGSDKLVTKNNDCIEIGARALNKNFEINVDERYIMHRLYVMNSELINSEAARAIQDNTNNDDVSNMYRQMGSCILNPFHRLGDAFDYIIAARKSNPELYRNCVFEVYIEGGTYYPYHNAYGEQDEVRNNTFLVPEAIYVIGGIDSRQDDHKYGQEGYFDMFTGASYGSETVNVTIPGTGYTINAASLDTIRLRDERHRPMRDNNLNSVIEPWELERQTILSGNAVAGEDFTHVYHVITMHADSTKVGPQPRKYKKMNPDYDKNNPKSGVSMFLLEDTIPFNRPDLFHTECDLSILGRTTEFDGIQITGGYANHLDPADTVQHHYQTKTYFRGGGIFVDGNWTESFDDPNDIVPNVTEPALYNIPIVVENCFFTNNMAGNGGGLYSNGNIYMYGCHFTQNYSQGPMTKLDQRFIPWTAGGCIATNAVCDICNSLFDNNEARRGKYPIIISGDEYIPDADARQGFGGVLSVAAQSQLRAVNCHFMKNKAVAYSAIYNFLANNQYFGGTDTKKSHRSRGTKNIVQLADSMQFAFNCIFWGNEVFEVDKLSDLEHIEGPAKNDSVDSEAAFATKYKASRSGVFHYDGDVWARYEKLYHEYDSLYQFWTSPERGAASTPFNPAVTDKLQALRQVGDSMEGLYFCSYRKGYGPTGMKPNKEGYLLISKDELDAYTDSRQTPVRLKVDANRDVVERNDSLFTYLHGNNNVLINRLNNAPDGPNFKQPSFVAGIDGYMQNADWLLARMNLTTDQGWGHLSQTVKRGVSYYITKYTGQTQYPDANTALQAAQDTVEARGMSITVTQQDVYPISGLPEAHFDTVPALQQAMQAIYNWYSYRYGYYMSDVNTPLPLGDDYYMHYTRSSNDTEMSGNMYRISKNPKMGEKDVYIDIGMYEYQYVQLDIKGQEIDTVWVATKDKGVNQNGLSWRTPTTDLQYAIDILMSSHNNHDKYVCFMGSDEDVFIPQQVLDNRRAFIISSNTLQPILPDSAMADFDYGVRSLNFLGGYSFDVEDAPRNPQANPTVIEMPNIGTASQRNQLFIVEDMTRQQTQANWQGEYMTRDSVVIPITFDGITFINPYSTKDPSSESYTSLGGLLTGQGGAAIYYRWQRIYEDNGGVASPNFNMALHPDSALIDGRKTVLPKLTISNCTFMDNGALTQNVAERSPAVFIGYGGGGSLIVNSLFHSNAGAPIFSRNSDPTEGETNFGQIHNPAVIVNSTFALNGGHLRLGCEESEIHNSLIWQDDLASDTTTQLQIGTAGETGDQYWVWDKNTNNDRPGLQDKVTNNAIWGCFVSGPDNWNNENLASDNNDIITGPNFMNPIDTATTSADKRLRDFRLNPGLKTMNTADTIIYRNKVFFHEYPDETVATENNYWRRPNGFKSCLIYTLANDSDLASKPRLSGLGMERGAFECQAVLQRILYVQPNLPLAMAGDGSSWESPLGQGQLQNAIDAAAVYTYLNRTATPETQKAYVFVKGSYESAPELFIKARDGVSVYGSLPSSFNDTAWINPDSVSTTAYTNGECLRFVNYVRSYVSGVASPNASPTRIGAVREGEGTFNLGFILDGFVITNPNDTLSASPVVLNNEHTVIRNCIITDNKVEGGAPVADIQNGLLYNTLIYNDSAEVLVRVGANGLVLNNTIIAEQAGVTPIDQTAAAAEAIQNNIALNTVASTPHCFATYMTGKQPYTIPSYLTQDPELAFQLHEQSTQINAGTNTLPAVFNTYIADSVICFWRDRDILGNPRKIGGTVDNGAFETWRVEPGWAVELTALTNEIIDTRITTASYTELRNSFKTNFGGNMYPHAGSVVYLMDSSAMTMQYDVQDFRDIKNNLIIFRPGYMLLKPGASFYGNGHEVQMNYLAVEKRFKNQCYSMTAMPFTYNAGNITSASYNAANDSMAYHLNPVSFATYQYNGDARSVKDYNFQPNNSSLWQRLDTTNRTATYGYLMDFGSTQDTLLRFTAFGSTEGEYVYTETAEETDKIVYLEQYDHRTVSGSGIDFTRQEDMGWNMKGLPWLVSNYRTDTILEDGNFQRQMYIPHVFYQMDGAGEYISDGDNIYTSRSWDPCSRMSMGNAFLTQTATQQEREAVYFHRPLYTFNEKATRPIVRMVRRNHSNMPQRNGVTTENKAYAISDYLIAMPDSTADKNVEYRYGRDGVKWQTDNAAVYLMDMKRLSRFSLLGSTPTEVDIPLGVKILEEDDYTFSLPEKDAFADYKHVWFIDYAHNKYTNLLKEDYTVSLSAGEENNRFALRIDGFPKVDKNGNRKYLVYAHGGILYVRGIMEGDQITIYSPSGKLVYSTTATGTEFTMPLPDTTGYFIKVNDSSHKVVNI